MSISQEKREFIKKTAPGIHVYMATTHQADEIAANAGEPAEEYIQTHMLTCEKSAINPKRCWFSQNLFHNFVDTMGYHALREVLLYLDNIDMCLCDVFVEAGIDTKDLSENEKKWGTLIMDGDLVTFGDFLDKY
jgi:hypothetical protein